MGLPSFQYLWSRADPGEITNRKRFRRHSRRCYGKFTLTVVAYIAWCCLYCLKMPTVLNDTLLLDGALHGGALLGDAFVI